VQQPKRLFRYSGNKSKLLHLYRFPEQGVSRVVEPYLGSGAFLLNQVQPGIGYDTNKDIVDMWSWLKGTTAKELHDLYKYVEDLKAREEKPSLKGRGLDNGPLTYLRVNVCSVVVGQLSSWKVYPQHKLPVESTIECLPRLRDVDVVLGDGGQHSPLKTDLMFIDPPYLGTTGNYKEGGKESQEEGYDPEKTRELIRKAEGPVVFTYGTNAPAIFPEYDWEIVKVVKVPNMRKGGTIDRLEHVCYINF
jgi:site-specific DNA-adenine methylase